MLLKAGGRRQHTSKPFALNLWIPFEKSDHWSTATDLLPTFLKNLEPFYTELGLELPAAPDRFAPNFDEQIEALIAIKPAVFSFVYGIPSAKILAKCKQNDIVTVGAATTVNEALALEAAGVDWIVASGFEAGGHRVSFLDSPERSLTGTFALIPQVVDAVKIPVIAAGGIADARGAAAAMALGASGIQVGTAFLACQESAASELHKLRLFQANAHDTALTKAFSGRMARGLHNRFMQAVDEVALAPYPVQNWMVGQLKAAALEQGRDDMLALWAGQGVGLLAHKPAALVVKELVRGITD